ncbi:MAG TPA: aminotransferase DegT [Acetobacteraceae bacterium]|nr:aminotransferase DegT [Acetobacteraceae bacterium]
MNEIIVNNAVMVGGGPGGLAPLLAACRHHLLPELLAPGFTLIERSPALGAGDLGNYVINSDSLADTFVSCIEGDTDPRLHALLDHPATQAIIAYRGGPVPLALAGEFLFVVGQTLQEIVKTTEGGTVLAEHEAISTQMLADGLWLTRVRNLRDNNEKKLLSRSVVLATGGSQPVERLESEIVAGAPLLPRYENKLIQSGTVLTQRGLDEVALRLQDLPNPKVAVVGGSQSAISAAHALLYRLPSVTFQPGGITVLHRRELRVTYESAAAAQADGYLEFGPDDICPVTGRVFRLAGFRLDSRELIMRVRGIGGRPPEERLRLHRLSSPDDQEARRILDTADLIVAALGYRPRALPILDAQSNEMPLLADGPGLPPLVDGECRILDANAKPLPGLFGIGLAAGFVPRGSLGGEPSFVGQANGLWLWQNDVGAMLARSVLRQAIAAA